MAHVDWRMKGRYLKNCNCAYGCPCDFNAQPTHGPCEGMAGMCIDEGHFGDVKLDGLHWAANYHWPGPLHEGNGTMQAFIDARATDAQRKALLTILSGKEQAEGTYFHILSLVVTNVLKPQFVAFEFDFDLDARTASMAVPGVWETRSTPIKNPVTGAPHRIQVHMPEGFEHRMGEIASQSTRGNGSIKFAFADRHSTLAVVEHTHNGVR